MQARVESGSCVREAACEQRTRGGGPSVQEGTSIIETELKPGSARGSRSGEWRP